MAERSGISRAMLSRVERGQSSPTPRLLAKFCDGVGVTLTSLLGGEARHPDPSLARRSDQALWRDPVSGYLRRTVSPIGTGSRVEIVEVEMPVGAAVVVDALNRVGHDRHVWVLDGALEVTRGTDVVALGAGDRLRLDLAEPIRFRNLGPTVARCAVVIGRAGVESGRG